MSDSVLVPIGIVAVVLAAMVLVSVVISDCQARKEAEGTRQVTASGVRAFHDDEAGVTCWTTGRSLTCLPDAQLDGGAR